MIKKYIKKPFWISLILFLIIGLLCFLITYHSKKEDKATASLYDSCIFIDPGHGGKDNGTSYEDIFEDELNLKFATILYEDLLNAGSRAFLTRIADYDLSSTYATNHKIEDLKKRIQYIENSHCDFFISLHLNYYPSGQVNGLQTFYQKNNEKSKQLGKILQNQINSLNKKDKEIKAGDFYLLNYCRVPGVLMEFGFLSSEYDRNLLQDENYLKKLSKIIIAGFQEYFLTIGS